MLRRKGKTGEMKRVGIIGAGRFGLSLAEALSDAGTEVLLIDRNNALVQGALKKATWAVQCDATSAAALTPPFL